MCGKRSFAGSFRGGSASVVLVGAFGTAFVFLSGMATGYLLRRDAERLAYESVRGKLQHTLDQAAYTELAAEFDDLAEVVEWLRGLQPLARGAPSRLWNEAPLYVWFHPGTRDYLIQQAANRRPLVRQVTSEKETELEFFERSGRISCSFAYEKGSNRLLRCTFAASGKSGIFEANSTGFPANWVYWDLDGDGRFEKFFDHRNAKVYERKGLEWVMDVDGNIGTGNPVE